MATPTFKNLPKDEWTKVATNVTAGMLHKVKTGPNVYRQTYIQPTGAAAPANDASLGVPIFDEGNSEPIKSGTGVDVYIRPKGVAGRIRVDV